MSAVRMCDNCGAVFPEGVEGSTILSGTKMVRDDRGRVRQEETTQDRCPDCSGSKPPQPRIAVGSVAAKSDVAEDADVVDESVRRERAPVTEEDRTAYETWLRTR